MPMFQNLEPDTEPNERQPATFVDNSGHVWNLTLNMGVILDMQQPPPTGIGVNLDDLLHDPNKFVTEYILGNPRKMVEIFSFLCNDQYTEREMSPGEFARIFTRPVIEAASTALLEAITLFYPRTAAGKVLAGKIPEMIREADRRTEEAAKQALPNLLKNNAASSV